MLDELATTLGPEARNSTWASFFEPARVSSEIGLHHPFYPAGPGGAKRAHIVDQLGLASAEEVYRCCERAAGRRACPMFWTLGGNQVGKAALNGWREILIPARARASVALWPFDGALGNLLGKRRSVVVETYPGDVYPYVGAGARFATVLGRHLKTGHWSTGQNRPMASGGTEFGYSIIASEGKQSTRRSRSPGPESDPCRGMDPAEIVAPGAILEAVCRPGGREPLLDGGITAAPRRHGAASASCAART